ncbi:MAG TPA: hypothetical protein ENI38_04405, partial [Candidatus Acetothermia bacterium]|nr:hypothetical protein [Candidatus Acetothermia bacterium]
MLQVQVTDAGEYGILANGDVSLHLEGSTFSHCGDGLRLLHGAMATVEGCAFVDNRLYGVAALSGSSVSGSGNEFGGNGCDLIGEVAPGVRTPLRAAELEEVLFPSPEFTSLQEALDALLPRGKLILSQGVQTAGAVINKPVVIQGLPGVLSAPHPDLPALSVVPGGELLLAGVEIRGGAFGLVVAGAASARLAEARVIGSSVGIAL